MWVNSADLLRDQEVCNFFVVPGAVRDKPLKNGAENASFLENSTACQKSTPVTFEKQISARTLCTGPLIPADAVPLCANTVPYLKAKAFTESLILAQDERWRRA